MLVALVVLVACGGLSPALASDQARDQVRIIGGTPVSQSSYQAAWPWVALVEIRPYIGSAQQCTGAVIAPQWVLTAAHCASGVANASRYRVHVGAAETSMMFSLGTVDHVVVDPAYAAFGPISAVGDVALLHLAFPAALARFPTLAAEPPPGTVPATALGWGRTSRTALAASSALHSVTVAVAPVSRGTLHNSGPRGTCNGDSGGPLVADGILIGTTSYGDDQCATDSHYAETSSVLPWILNTTMTFGGVQPRVATPPTVRARPVWVRANVGRVRVSLPAPTTTGGTVTCSRPATRTVLVPSRTSTTCRARTGGGTGTTTYVVTARKVARAIGVRSLSGRRLSTVTARKSVVLRAGGFAPHSRVLLRWGPVQATGVATATGVVHLRVRAPRARGRTLITLTTAAAGLGVGAPIAVRAESIAVRR